MKKKIDEKRMLKFFIAFVRAMEVLPLEERRRIVKTLVVLYGDG